MSDARVKVLYITGAPRSGTTLLDQLLGQVEGFFPVSELSTIWDRGLLENWLCGCGAPFRDCDVWRKVLAEAYGGMDAVDPREMLRLQLRATRIRRLPRLLLGRWTGRPDRDVLGRYPEELRKLYRAIRHVTGCRVIVDSSKIPGYGYVLGTLPGIELYVVHLVRDPRAVAHSWMTPQPQPDRAGDHQMHRAGALESSLVWDVWNVTAEALWGRRPERYLRLRYEDFTSDPRAGLERVLALVGELPARLPFVDERTVAVGPNHTVSGNTNRFERGTMEIRPSRKWMAAMKAAPRRVVTALTLPLLVRYGYPVRMDGAARAADDRRREGRATHAA